MLIRPLLSLAVASTMLLGVLSPQAVAPVAASDGPVIAANKELQFPAQYREWVYLGSGVDMSYNPKEEASDHSMFNTVFVNPSSYRAFLKTGTWPDGTALVLENSGAVHGGEKQASLNKHGLTQTGEIMGLEVHVKDASLPGGWGFYSFDNMKSARIIPQAAPCYSCHQQHAAVDTTFVQFYPTLLAVAKDKGTLSKAYVSEMGSSTK
ncbi:cytochrome P460 family protein [Granulicella aggregans]|uniref:cytochrome P460 family protein n=1 Tax=Granulicella aggregans TaxID=474949 RepID=UPI0021DF624D|nr:cytochrome P460 family protein [Granulicella aggregans]